MNKLIACALLGLGLTQALVACSSDDDSSSSTGGTGGASKGGTSSGGASGKGGSSAQGGSSSGGKGGASGGGGGSAGKAGSGSGGTMVSMGGTAPAAGMGGVDIGAAGDMSAGGEAGAPAVVPVQATQLWLNEYCLARAQETLGCAKSPAWQDCFAINQPYLSTTQGALCQNETDTDNHPLTTAVWDSFDQLATLCKSPTTSQMHCNLNDEPEFLDAACRDADAAHAGVIAACGQ